MPRPVVATAIQAGVRGVAHAVSSAWFRSVEESGLERLPAGGPVLLCANHLNGVVDPLVLVGWVPRLVRPVAKSALWRRRPVGWLLDLAGVIPVPRARDGDTGGPAQAFAACARALAAGDLVAIFPEGNVTDETRLQPLRTGAARIALGARAAGVRGLLMLPVGLVYADKTMPRSRVLIRYGEPVVLDDWLAARGTPGADPDDRGTVQALTAELSARLALVALDLADDADLPELYLAAQVWCLPDPGQARALTIATVEPVLRRLAALDGPARTRVVAAAVAYHRGLEALGLQSETVAGGLTVPAIASDLRRTAVRVGLLTPVALAGTVVNGPTWLLVDAVRRMPVARASRANNAILAGLVAFPLTWTGWALLARRSGRAAHPWWLGYLGGTAGGAAAVTWWETVGDVRRARLHVGRLVQAGSAASQLASLRAELTEAVRAAGVPGVAGS